jgi:hypothetical protein
LCRHAALILKAMQRTLLGEKDTITNDNSAPLRLRGVRVENYGNKTGGNFVVLPGLPSGLTGLVFWCKGVSRL